MSRLSKREKVLLVLLLVALAGLLYYNFVLKSFIEDNNALNLEIESKQALIQDYKLKDASVKMIDERLAKLHEETDDILGRVLTGIDRSEILKMLGEAVGSVCNDPDYLFIPGYVTVKESSITTVEVTFTCSENQLRTILRNLQNTRYVNRVTTAAFGISDRVNGTGTARIDIELLAHGTIPPSDPE